jgi:hypothetical protein
MIENVARILQCQWQYTKRTLLGVDSLVHGVGRALEGVGGVIDGSLVVGEKGHSP